MSITSLISTMRMFGEGVLISRQQSTNLKGRPAIVKSLNRLDERKLSFDNKYHRFKKSFSKRTNSQQPLRRVIFFQDTQEVFNRFGCCNPCYDSLNCLLDINVWGILIWCFNRLVLLCELPCDAQTNDCRTKTR